MINRLLKDSRTINTTLVSTGRIAGNLMLSAYPAGKMAEGSHSWEKHQNSSERRFMKFGSTGTGNQACRGHRSEPERQLLQVNAQLFRECFDRRPFLIGHHLVGHPLFELPRLIRLSQNLAEANVEYNAGDIPINVTPDSTPRNGLSATEPFAASRNASPGWCSSTSSTIRTIAPCFIHCLAEVARHSERSGRGCASARVSYSFPRPHP